MNGKHSVASGGNKNCIKWVLLSMCAALFFISGCAKQEDLMAVYNRTLSLEKRQTQAEIQNEELKNQVKSTLEQWEADAAKLREDVAEMRAATESVRGEVRKFHGLLEEQGYQLRTKVGAVETTDTKARESMAIVQAKLDSMNDSILRLEAYLGVEDGKIPAKTGVEPAEEPEPEELDEAATYSRAKEAFDAGRLEASREAFKAFLGKFPNSDNADNALFWIGETYFQEKWYEKAILQYQDVIDKYPEANKVPAAYLKQGLSFSMLGDNSNARIVWNQLIKKFPGSPEAVLAKKHIDAIKTGA